MIGERYAQSRTFRISGGEPREAGLVLSERIQMDNRKLGGPVDYWLITTGPEWEPGINGAIARKQDTI